MPIRVSHSITYRYDTPAGSVIQILRLTPRNHDGQYIAHWRIDVSSDCRLDQHEDAFGYITHAFTADGPRGPNMIAKPGPVQLADLTAAPWIGSFHGHPSRSWQLNSWDRFMIPKPFSTITFSWPAHVAPELTLVQHALDEAVHTAEVNNH